MDNFIEVYKNVYSQEYCNDVIEFFNKAEALGLTINRQQHDGVIKLEKDDSSLFLSEFPIEHSTRNIYDIFQAIFWDKCYRPYAEKYSMLAQLEKHRIYSMKIQKTKPGQGYHMWHCEVQSRESSNRALTWTVYLNDNFEAGETEFLYQQYRYKPSKGDVVIFPTAFTHTHRGNPPIGGDKYIITGWIEF